MTLREEVLKNSGLLTETVLLTKPGELYVKIWNYVFLVKNTGKVYMSSAKSDNKELYDYIMSATTISVYNWKNIHNTFGERLPLHHYSHSASQRRRSDYYAPPSPEKKHSDCRFFLL